MKLGTIAFASMMVLLPVTAKAETNMPLTEIRVEELRHFVAGKIFTYGQAGTNLVSERYYSGGKFLFRARLQVPGTYEIKNGMVCTTAKYPVATSCKKILKDAAGGIYFRVLRNDGKFADEVKVGMQATK